MQCHFVIYCPCELCRSCLIVLQQNDTIDEHFVTKIAHDISIILEEPYLHSLCLAFIRKTCRSPDILRAMKKRELSIKVSFEGIFLLNYYVLYL